MKSTPPPIGPAVLAALALAIVFTLGANLSFAQQPAVPSAAAPPAKVEIPNARTPLEGVLTGGQPTEEQLAEMAKAGYRTVVNLRTPGENEVSDREAELAERLGLRYVHLPMAGAEGLTEDNARALKDLLADESAYPVVVHCGSGNRVGALFALKAFYFDCNDGKTAVEIGREAGLTRLEPAVREKLGVKEQ